MTIKINYDYRTTEVLRQHSPTFDKKVTISIYKDTHLFKTLNSFRTTNESYEKINYHLNRPQ
jgi:hypothetical protein